MAMATTLRIVFLLLVQLMYCQGFISIDTLRSDVSDNSSQPLSTSSTLASDSSTQPLTSRQLSQSGIKVAFCLTGQLTRLEILSKLNNILIPNSIKNNEAHLFVYLDNEIEKIKQTYWNYNYSMHLYGRYSETQLRDYIKTSLNTILTNKGYNNTCMDDINSRIKIHVKLSPPSRHTFHVINSKVLVKDKKYSGHDGPKTNYESAESRFQNNLRWMNGLRDCIRYMQLIEYRQGYHYDVVVRLRDDSFVLSPWLLTSQYIGRLTALKSGNFRGINDHNLAVDRKYADSLFRGLIEDYYFNKSLGGLFWGNAEHRISMMVQAYNIPLHEVSICEQGLIPLRGLVNESYWRLHPLYIRHFTDDCAHIRNIRSTLGSGQRNLLGEKGQGLGQGLGQGQIHGHQGQGHGQGQGHINHQQQQGQGQGQKVASLPSAADVSSYPSACCSDRWMQILRLRAIHVTDPLNS